MITQMMAAKNCAKIHHAFNRTPLELIRTPYILEKIPHRNFSVVWTLQILWKQLVFMVKLTEGSIMKACIEPVNSLKIANFFSMASCSFSKCIKIKLRLDCPPSQTAIWTWNSHSRRAETHFQYMSAITLPDNCEHGK